MHPAKFPATLGLTDWGHEQRENPVQVGNHAPHLVRQVALEFFFLGKVFRWRPRPPHIIRHGLTLSVKPWPVFSVLQRRRDLVLRCA